MQTHLAFVAMVSLVVGCAEETSTESSTETPAWNMSHGEKDDALVLIPDLDNGRAIFRSCADCHLPEGWGTVDGTLPQLAGQHRTVLIKQLADIRMGNRDNPTMYPFALAEAIGGAQALADVTHYIQNLPMSPVNGKGPWVDEERLKQGEMLYEANCRMCHREEGQGSYEMYYPRLQGQHYVYLLRQSEWIRDGKRRNANLSMVRKIAKFSNEDLQLVLNYVSRIPVPQEDLAPSMEWKNPDFD